MANDPTIDPYSIATVPIEMRYQATPLSIGTAFVLRSVLGGLFLITNWHNVTGINPKTGANLSPSGGRPDRILAYFPIKNQIWSKTGKFINLRDKYERPRWLVHPELGKNADLVALPFNAENDTEVFPLNNLSQDDLALNVGHEVFILGYPFGIGTGGLPVWKRASLASEPQIFSDDQRYMLVDTASRPGMSGSPVIRRSWATHTYANGSIGMGQATATKFVGIYSGRLATSDALDAQLGLVWPSVLIDDVLAKGVVDI